MIDEWLPKFAVNAGVALDARTQTVYRSIWLEGLGDLSPEVLLAAFRKTLRDCPFWPIKVADIRKHVTHAVANATTETAEQAWKRVVEIRREHWSPDIPGSFNRAFARLSERVRRASQAAGIFREFTAEEWENGALHTWAKKRFVESFQAWGESERDKFLLPDGEAKNLLIEVAETKALPWTKPKEVPQLPPEERLRIADELADAARKVLGLRKPSVHQLKDTPERREELRRQAELILQKYPLEKKSA